VADAPRLNRPDPAAGRSDGRPRAAGATDGRPDGRPPPRRNARVRVELQLDGDVLEDLELLRHYRHGHATRSEVVREAIGWLRAREAAWLIRAHEAQRNRRQREQELERARQEPREDRDRQEGQALVVEALAIAREWLAGRQAD